MVTSFGPRTILVVDDEDATKRYARQILRRMGVGRILEADDGMRALEIICKHQIDAVLCDWQMPAMDGLELLIAVRSNPQCCKMPFLMMTSTASRERVQEAVQSGVSEFLVKPLTQHVIEAKLGKVLEP